MFKSFTFRIYIVALILRLIPIILTRGLGIGLDDMFQYDMLARSLAGGHGFRWYAQADLDRFASFLQVLFLGSGLFGVALAYGYLKRMGIERGEYYALLLFSVTGMLLMAQAADLIVIFLALELLSIPLYVLAAFARPKVDSEEAGIKYFLLGAFAIVATPREEEPQIIVPMIDIFTVLVMVTELPTVLKAKMNCFVKMELFSVGI